MDQVLLYTTIGYNEKYLDLLVLFCESLCYTAASKKNLLVITDAKFHSRVEAIVSKYAMLNYYILDQHDSKTPEEASTHKVNLFEFKEIYNFRYCLYVDVDCLFLNDVFTLFKRQIQDGKLYVYAESRSIEDHKMKWFSLQTREGGSFYTPEDYAFLAENKKYPFNAGLFLLKISANNEKSFKGLQEFMKSYDGVGFYEQSYMNTYFCLNGMADYSYFESNVAMQSTHNIDESIVKTTSCFGKETRKPITSAHVILHFNATMPGAGDTKLNGMKKYMEKYLLNRKHSLRVYDNRIEMINNILPENAKIAEIGVFKGDFAKEILKTNPSHLYLIDCWEKGEVVSGDADGNNVEHIKNAEDLYHKNVKQFRFQPNVSIHRDYSFNVLLTFEDHSLDAIYIDGDHSYDGVKKDLELAVRKVKKYGLIMGHDYDMNMAKARTRYEFGVKRAVDELCMKYNLSLYAKGEDGCVSFAIINTADLPTDRINFQFVAISINNERRASLMKQISTLFGETPLRFVDTYNPPDYFPMSATSDEKKVMDCARNHFKALEYACKEESPEFSIILEDDVSFNMKHCKKAIAEIISNWAKYAGGDKLLSIGWIPFQSYNSYNVKYTSIHEFGFENYKLFNQFYAYGLQAYIVRKKDVLDFPSILIQPTYDDYIKAVKSKNFSELNDATDLMPADFVLPRVLGQRTLFPPLAIETYSPSCIGHYNVKYWKNFFTGAEDLVHMYYGHEHDSDVLSANYFLQFPELEIFKSFKQVIIWGYPFASHTHSYIHNAWHRTFKALHIPVFWFWDKDYPKDFDYTNSCFITEGWVDKNIPLLPSCTYFVHIAQNPQKYLSVGARLIDIRFNLETIDDYNYKYVYPEKALKLSNETLYEVVEDDSAVAEKRGRTVSKTPYEAVYMYWATDILPHEFDYDDAKRNHDRVFNHVGTLEKGHPIYNFATLLDKEGISFNRVDPWTAPVSYEYNIALMKQSYCCPDFRNVTGVDNDRTGYVPCRVFKAISYGHTGITNSLRTKHILGDHVEYVENIEEILNVVEKRKNDVKWRTAAMEHVADHHTFLNRARDLARAIAMKKL